MIIIEYRYPCPREPNEARSSIVCRFFAIIDVLAVITIGMLPPLLAMPSLGCCEEPLDTTRIIFHFHGPDTSSYIGQRITSLGDINSDGFDDIAISSFNPAGTYIFYGGDPADTVSPILLRGYLGAAPPIDVDGDGVDEIPTYFVRSIGISKCHTGIIYRYKTYADSVASEPYDSLVLDSGCFDHDMKVRTGYVDRDSSGDLLTVMANMAGGPMLVYYSSLPTLDEAADWNFQVENYKYTIRWFDLMDYNGDGWLDICAGMNADKDTAGYVYIFLGPDFGAAPDVIIAKPEQLVVDLPEHFANFIANVGDYNGDGWDDLAVGFQRGSPYQFIYCCGPSADTLYDYRLGKEMESIAAAGDVNGDGYNDLFGGGSGSWSGVVCLYLGGPKADSLFDLVIGRYDLPPVFLHDIGYRVSTAGDFNCDGTDDFMFSCINYASGHPYDVFVMSGSSQIVSDVDDLGIIPIPGTIMLYQNRPNPFNPSTTIEYTIPRATHVTIAVYNILGQRIRTLLDPQRTAGCYSIT